MTETVSSQTPAHERPKWVPPVLLAGLAFGFGFLLDAVDVARHVASCFRSPPLPKVSQEYLMIEVESGRAVRDSLEGVMSQVTGLRINVPAWLENFDSDVARLRKQFCENSESVATTEGAAAHAPEQRELIERCVSNAETLSVLIGTYALRSFDPEPISELTVELARLSSPDGWVDGYDGFLSGKLDTAEACFRADVSGDCVAAVDGRETISNLPTLGPGEMIALPIFLSAQFRWYDSEADIEAYDGLIAAPFTFPSQVRLGDRVLIAAPRPMNETPSLREGFYEGRG